TSECGREWPRAGPRRPECPVAGRTGLGRARAGRWRQVRRRVAGGTIVSRWIGGLMVALLATACGVALDSAPETIAVDLGDASELDLPVGDDLAPVTFVLVEDGGLVPVTHELPLPISVESVTSFLVEGIDPTGNGPGLRT